MDHLQRRDLQPRRAPPRARGEGAPVPDPQRHRDDPAPLRGGGRRLRGAAPGHVRLRPLGSERGAPAARAGSARDQAPVLRGERAGAPVRLRDQGDPGGDGRATRAESGGRPRVSRHSLPRRRRDLLPGHPQAPAGPRLHVVAGRRAPTASLLVPADRHGRVLGRSRAARRRPRGAPGGDGPQPPHERRAARPLPVRRARLDRPGGADGADGERSHPDVRGRLRRPGEQRAALCPGRGAGGRSAAPRGGPLRRRVLPGPAPAHLARGRADRLPLEHRAQLRVAARPVPREGGPHRRGGRRALPRLQLVPADRVERGPRPALLGLDPAGGPERESAGRSRRCPGRFAGTRAGASWPWTRA